MDERNENFYDYGDILIPKETGEPVLDYHYSPYEKKYSRIYPILYYHFYHKNWRIGDVPFANKFVFKPIPSLKYFEIKQHIVFKNEKYKQIAAAEELTPYTKLWKIKVPLEPQKIKNELSMRDAKTITVHYTTIPSEDEIKEYAQKNNIQLSTYNITNLIKTVSEFVYSDIKYQYLKVLLPKLVSFMPVIIIARGALNENIEEMGKNNISEYYKPNLANSDNIYILRLTNSQLKDFNHFHYDKNPDKIDYTSPLENTWITYEDLLLQPIQLPQIPTNKMTELIKELIITRYEVVSYINYLKMKNAINYDKWVKIIEVYNYFLSR